MGAAAFRGALLRPETESGKLLFRWIEEGHFQWLYSEEILDEYKEILKRFNVRPGVIGRFINPIREEGVSVRVRKSGSVSPDPGDDPCCACAAQGNASFLVSLNPRDFPQQRLDAKIIHLAKTCPRREKNDQRGANVGPPWKGQPCRKYRIWQCCIASSMICRPTGKGLAASYVADPVTLY